MRTAGTNFLFSLDSVTTGRSLVNSDLSGQVPGGDNEFDSGVDMSDFPFVVHGDMSDEDHDPFARAAGVLDFLDNYS